MERLFRVLRGFARIFGTATNPAELSEISNQTERVSARLIIINAIVLVALILAGLANKGGVNVVIWALIGAFASAILGGALGLLFGLPTAETKRTVLVANQSVATPNANQIAAGGAAPATAGAQPPPSVAATAAQVQEEIDTGYRDSTSLEQIADWLTKIIVGLTLTQFAAWEDRFQRLASNLTEAMAGETDLSKACEALIRGLEGNDLVRALDLPMCRASAIPGGVIIALFATTGFLVTYLWMRRYFILEMVIARKQAKELLAEKTRLIRERAAGEAELAKEVLAEKRREVEIAQVAAEQQKTIEAAREVNLAEQSRGREIISDPEIEEILNLALQRVAEESKAHAALLKVRKKVADETTDPDDPWRGKFGEASAVNGVRLDATVAPIAGDPYFFDVDLCVRAETDKRKTDLLGTKVLYFLHPTFGGQPKISFFGSDGTAPLEVYAYGAFTVGAQLEDGTALELNLATLESAPARFLAQ